MLFIVYILKIVVIYILLFFLIEEGIFRLVYFFMDIRGSFI